MKASRRTVLAGAAALPLAAQARAFGLEGRGETVLVYDPALPAAQAFAEAGRTSGRAVIALDIGRDRIRQARELFASRPTLVRGVSRQADAVLVEEVAREAGYHLVAQQVDGVVIDWTLAPRSSAGPAA